MADQLSGQSSFFHSENGGRMFLSNVTRRRFMGGLATALGMAGLSPFELVAQQRGRRGAAVADSNVLKKDLVVEYDKMVKLANNENPYGPPESVLKVMNDT